MWNSYSLYFDRPEFSFISYETRQTFISTSIILNFIILWGSLILTIIKFRRKKVFSLIAPLASGLTILAMYHVKSYYPDSNSEWTKNGYQIKKQHWFNGDEKFTKIWRSKDSLEKYDSHNDIVWIKIKNEEVELTDESRLDLIKDIIQETEDTITKSSKDNVNK